MNSKNYGRFRYLKLQYIWTLKLFPVVCCYMDGTDGHCLLADVSYFLCCTRKRLLKKLGQESADFLVAILLMARWFGGEMIGNHLIYL